MKPALLTALLLVAVSVAVGQPGPRAPERLAWEQAGALAAPRAYATAVTLVTGEILVVGGLDKDDPKVTSVTSELFDPLTGHARVLDQRLPGRVNHAAVAGAGGRVAIIGGSVWIGDGWAITDRVDVYLPYEHRWKEGQPMLHGRTGVRATALEDGGVFEYAGTLAVPRMVADAAALPDGRAIVTGGLVVTAGPVSFDPSARTELWDPATNRWREVAPVSSGRAFARLISTADGIYQVSGVALGEQAQARVERFVWH